MGDTATCVHDNFDAFNRHDTEGVINTYTEDCELIDSASPAPVYGHDFLREHMGNLLLAFPDIQLEGARTLSGDHVVAAEFVLVGTHSGEFLGYEASGNVLRWMTCSFFDLTDDDSRIKREFYYYDLASVVAQLQ